MIGWLSQRRVFERLTPRHHQSGGLLLVEVHRELAWSVARIGLPRWTLDMVQPSSSLNTITDATDAKQRPRTARSRRRRLEAISV